MPAKARVSTAGEQGFAHPPEKLRYRVVALGASAGGLRSISAVLARLTANLPCGVLVAQHLSPDHKSLMVELLLRRTSMPVHQAVDGEEIRAGVAHIAPPGQHLLAQADRIRLMGALDPHLPRPSINLLFESLASNHGRRVIAVVLSGSGTDGALGVRAVKAAGGTTLAEDPSQAEFASMPYAAIETGCVDMVLTAEQIGDALIELCAVSDE